MSSAERKKLTVAVLRAALKSLGLNTRGKKAALLARVAEASRNYSHKERKGDDEQRGAPANKKMAVSDAVSVESPIKEVEQTEQQKNEGETEENIAEAFKSADSDQGKRRYLVQRPLADGSASKDREDFQEKVVSGTEYDTQKLYQAKTRSHIADKSLPTVRTPV